MKRQLIFVLLVSVALKGHAQSGVPKRLRVDFLLMYMDGRNSSPTISRDRPWLSWETNADDARPPSFHLLVASSPDLLAKNRGDCWDVQQVPLTGIRYAGKKLETGKVYYWKVQDAKAPFSAAASFSMDTAFTDTVSHYQQAVEEQQVSRFVSIMPGEGFFDFGKEAFAQLQLHLDSPAADSAIIEAGEMANGLAVDANAGRNIRYTKIKLAIQPGIHDYTIVWPADEKRNSRDPVQMPASIGEVYPFRYVKIRSKAALNEGSVTRRAVHNPFDEDAAYFVSSDTVLNKVWALCKYTMKATGFLGFYVDGDRERIPYEADALINQLSHYAVDAEYSMARRTLAYLIYHPTWPTEWSLQDVLIAWNDYMYTGDPSFLEKYYTELQKKILMPLQDSSGLISTRTGKQSDALLQSVHRKDFDGRHEFSDIVDWPQTGTGGLEKENPGETDGFVFSPYNAVVNAFYFRNLVLMEKIASVLGKTGDVGMYRAKCLQVYRSYRRVFAKADGLIRDGNTTQHSSLHANMFALDFGLVPKIDMPRVIAFIESRKMACSVYGAQFLLEALYEGGADVYAQQLMSATTRRSWYNMIRNQATIALEAWDKRYKPNLDMNHAWGAAPANIIVRKLMGLEPAEPGFSRMRIRPRMGGLQFAKLVAPTIKGKVEIVFERSPGEQRFDLVLPGHTSAELQLPAGKNSRLLIDGKLANAPVENGDFIIRHVPPGEHHFIIRPK